MPKAPPSAPPSFTASELKAGGFAAVGHRLLSAIASTPAAPSPAAAELARSALTMKHAPRVVHRINTALDNHMVGRTTQAQALGELEECLFAAELLALAVTIVIQTVSAGLDVGAVPTSASSPRLGKL